MALARIFAVDVFAYAVMSNHLHVVLRVDPDAARAWPADEIARRWLGLFRPSLLDESEVEDRVRILALDQARIDRLRQRLGSLSWFMRCLKEPIARWANAEDGCTGRFWEGRYRCQALLDEAAVLSCMTYVDLNPVRAGMASDPVRARHTSAARREALHQKEAVLSPVAGTLGTVVSEISEIGYRDLLRWTAALPDRAELASSGSPLSRELSRLGFTESQWLRQVTGTEIGFARAIGTFESLVEKAHQVGQRWLCGVRFAQRQPAAP